MKFNGFSTFLYWLAEFHLVLHFVLRLRKARTAAGKDYGFSNLKTHKVHPPLARLLHGAWKTYTYNLV
jgi:hypothetical protein